MASSEASYCRRSVSGLKGNEAAGLDGLFERPVEIRCPLTQRWCLSVDFARRGYRDSQWQSRGKRSCQITKPEHMRMQKIRFITYLGCESHRPFAIFECHVITPERARGWGAWSQRHRRKESLLTPSECNRSFIHTQKDGHDPGH